MNELRVLVVEDEPVMRERLVQMLLKARATGVESAPVPVRRLMLRSSRSSCWTLDCRMATATT